MFNIFFHSLIAGHVWGAYNGMSELITRKAAMSAKNNSICFSADAQDGANACVLAESDIEVSDLSPVRWMRTLVTRFMIKQQAMQGMTGLLKHLAEYGYVPFANRMDPRVRLISEKFVGGVMIDNANAPGVPLQCWDVDPRPYGNLVVTNQSMRLLLAANLAAQAKRNEAKMQ